MNVQFAIKDGVIFVLEVNPRASRTVPFVAKATDSAIAAIAARLMAGEPMSNFPLRAPYAAGVGPDTALPLADAFTLADPITPWFSVKEAVLPFARFPGVDPVLGPEMRSTGEVMGWDRTFALAFLKAQMGAGVTLPETGRVFVSIKDMDKTDAFAASAREMVQMGFWLAAEGVTATRVSKVYEGRPNIVDRLKNNDIAMVMNTTEGTQAIADSRDIRRVALMDKIPYFTTIAASIAVVAAMKARGEGYGVRTLQG
jgi:carbamoyl-phosphate synthase large subunit